jgi:hypothetical protein
LGALSPLLGAVYPFSILALEAICESVQGNCIAMIEGELRDDKLVNSRGVKSY